MYKTCDDDKALAAIDIVTLKTAASFRAALRTVVRGYVRGGLSNGDFVLDFFTVIGNGYRNAWKVGAATCGIKPSEFTGEIEDKIQSEINGQLSFISGFRDTLVLLSEGGKMNAELSKVDIWAKRWDEQRQKAMTELCGRKKLMWVLGVAEHCKSCISLNGIVKPAAFWKSQGVLPRVAGASYLECRGYRCQCGFKPTRKAITKGPLPSLP